MGTWLTGLVVVFIVGLAIRKVYKDRQNGKSCSCCSECPGCMSGQDGTP